MKRLFLSALLALSAAAAYAVAPATDIYIPSVGHGQGSCPGGICSQWRTDVWVYNPSASTTAAVTISYLPRDTVNTSPQVHTVSVAPGETKEYVDIVLDMFGADGFGALRFVSTGQVVVTGRIYDANVVTNKGTGSAGQFFGGLPATQAIGSGQSTSLIGLAQDADNLSRTNFGFVETTGNQATVQVTKVDGSGATLAQKSYTIRAREPKQFPISDVGGALGTNQRLIATVTGGTGRVLAFASRLDNLSGDPSTVEMVTQAATGAPSAGIFDGTVLTADGQYIDGGVELGIDSTGVTAYTGVAGLPCSSFSYVVDFYGNPAPSAPIAGDGTFSTSTTIPYADPSNPAVTMFSITWTLSGALSNGAITGTLRSVTTGGAGSNAGCNGTVDRPWRAGWTGTL